MFVYLLYGTYVSGFFFSLLFFSSFLGTRLDILYLFLPFCLLPRPAPPFNRKLHQGMGGFKLSFLVCFTQFSEEGRGWW